MSRKLLSALIVILILVMAYAGVWFFSTTVMKQSLITVMDSLSKREDINLSYSRIKAGGFPNKLEITIENPKVVYGQNDQEVTFTSDEIKFISGLNSKELKVFPGKEIGAKENNIVHQSNISIIYNKGLLGTLLFNEPVIKALLLEKELKATNLDVVDYGYKVMDLDDNEEIFISDKKNTIKVKMDLGKKKSFFDIGIKSSLIAKGGELSELGKISYNVNIATSLINNNDIEHFKINGFNISTDIFSIKSSGYFSASFEGRALPNGKIKVSINDYEKLVYFLGKQDMVAQPDVAVSLLKKIADADRGEKNIEFDIIRDSDSDPKIGEMSLGDVLYYYYTTGGRMQSEEKEDK